MFILMILSFPLMLITDYVVLDNLFLILLGMVMGWSMHKLTNTWVYKQNLARVSTKGELETKVKGLLDKVIIDYSILKENYTFLVDIFRGDRKIMQVSHRRLHKEFNDKNSFGVVIYVPVAGLGAAEISKLENILKELVTLSSPPDATYYVVDIGVDCEKGSQLILKILKNVFMVQSNQLHWTITEEETPHLA